MVIRCFAVINNSHGMYSVFRQSYNAQIETLFREFVKGDDRPDVRKRYGYTGNRIE